MAVQFHVMQSSGKLCGAVYDRLERILNEAYDACSQKLKFADIDLVVMNAPINVIPRLGEYGFSHDANQITLSLDVDHHYLSNPFSDIRLAHCSLFTSRGNQGCVLPWR